eukprot:GHVL01037584.1.p1 GENE.GHVL01037584.1~~GHVL01037584.1.p1  ORF type:complete len:629 (+),score=50.56 GHVL01037584.1:54-1940(+)
MVERERWSSRVSFIIASVGAACGIGNLWRFPSLAYAHGGGTFFIPYLLSLFIIGVPMMMLEFGLGQLFQGGHVVAFAGLSRRSRGVGVASLYGAGMVMVYYSVIIAWCVLFFVRSFENPLPWSALGNNNAWSFFQDILAKVKSEEAIIENPNPESFNGFTFLAVLVTWLFVMASIFKGAAVTGKIAYFTMCLPFIFLLVLIIRGAQLEGANVGIRNYIGLWDLSALSGTAIWTDAVSQTFFSTSVALGILVAYASYNSKNANVAMDAILVIVFDSLTSLVAGFTVFALLGHVSVVNNIPFNDISTGGLGVAFAAYPVGLAGLPIPQLWSVLFFLTLFLLGVDSAFAMAEGIATAVYDCWRGTPPRRIFVVGIICTSALVASLVYCTDIGLALLDAIDWYINHVTVPFVAMMETLAVGWMYDWNHTIATIGSLTPVILFTTWTLGPAFCVILGGAMGGQTGQIVGWVLGAVILMIGLAVSLLLTKATDEMSVKEAQYFLLFHGVEKIRTRINQSAEGVPKSKWNCINSVPFAWSVIIKFLVPLSLIVLMGLDFTSGSFGNYAGLPVGFQVIGGIAGLIGPTIVLVAVFFPDLFWWAVQPVSELDMEKGVKSESSSEIVGDIKTSEAIEA